MPWLSACAACGFCVYIEPFSSAIEAQLLAEDAHIRAVGDCLHALVFRVFLALRSVQHPLRNHLAQAVHGPVRSHQRADLHCAFHVYGRPGIGLVGEWSLNPKIRRPHPASRSPPIRAHRTADRYFGPPGALSVGVGTASAGAERGLFFRGLSSLLWSLDRPHPGSLVRLHGSHHPAGHAGHPKQFST